MNTLTTHPSVPMAIKTKIREEKMLAGTLCIREYWVDGERMTSVFTLESLAHVLGLPMSTIEGRYKRAVLSRWCVPVHNGAGRPMRGFPYLLLPLVIEAIQNPRSVVVADESGSGIGTIKPVTRHAELIPEYFDGQAYFTVAAIARAFGLSETTVRKKLRTTGVLRSFETLSQRGHGGRPTRGIAKRYLGHVQLAITQHDQFLTALDQAMAKSNGTLQAAQLEMEATIAAHTPPDRGSLQAWDADALAPVHRAPVNAVNSSDPAITQMMADVEAILASHNMSAPEHQATPEWAASAPQSEHPTGNRNPFMDG